MFEKAADSGSGEKERESEQRYDRSQAHVDGAYTTN